MPTRPRGAVLMLLIAISKLFEAALLIAVAMGLGHLLKHGVEDTLTDWVRAVRVDPENRYVQKLVTTATGMSRRRMEALRLGTLLYGMLFCVEGVGLLLRKRWAEYVTVITTAGFLPIEGYELVHKFSAVKVVVAAVNLLIVVYLVVRLWRGDEQRAG